MNCQTGYPYLNITYAMVINKELLTFSFMSDLNETVAKLLQVELNLMMVYLFSVMFMCKNK